MSSYAHWRSLVKTRSKNYSYVAWTSIYHSNHIKFKKPAKGIIYTLKFGNSKYDGQGDYNYAQRMDLQNIMLLFGMLYISADLHVQFVSLQQFLHQSRGEVDVPLFPAHATRQ